MIKKKRLTYYDFMQSNDWKVQSFRIKKRDGFTCRLCGATKMPVEAHHLRYLEDFTQVPDKDIITLCIECHRNLHIAKVELKNSLAQEYDYRNIQKVISLLKLQSKQPVKEENKVVTFFKNLFR